MTTLIDISPLVDAAIHVWPGDTPYVHTVNLDMAGGANITLSDIHTTVHVGAHADAPNHYLAGGEDIASRRLEYYIGPCAVIGVDVAHGARILPRHVDAERITAPRVLFRTGTFRDHHRWNDDFAALSPELVDFLHGRGVILVGIDTPSVGPFQSKELEAHQALDRHD